MAVVCKPTHRGHLIFLVKFTQICSFFFVYVFIFFSFSPFFLYPRFRWPEGWVGGVALPPGTLSNAIQFKFIESQWTDDPMIVMFCFRSTWSQIKLWSFCDHHGPRDESIKTKTCSTCYVEFRYARVIRLPILCIFFYVLILCARVNHSFVLLASWNERSEPEDVEIIVSFVGKQNCSSPSASPLRCFDCLFFFSWSLSFWL